MKCELGAGDCVRLNGGGPIMTVKDVGEYNHEKDMACCEWFDGTKLKEACFKQTSLKKIKMED